MYQRNLHDTVLGSVQLSLLVLSALLFLAPAYAQITNANLAGTVTDPSGSPIPGANVSATHVVTGITTKTITDQTGNYILPSLSPGVYNISIEKTGFKATVISGVTLLVDQKAQVDATLEVGAVTTKVEVTGAASLVETRTASLGTVVGEQDIVDLPLNLRRFGELVLLAPGAVAQSGGLTMALNGSPFSEQTYAVNGGRASGNNIVIDGMDARNLDFGGFSIQPPPDAIQEFKIEEDTYNAAFGIVAGSTINLVTKSGTNQLHGSAYEFLRNNDLDSRNFFATNQTVPVTNQQIPGSARPEYRRNQFGFTLGGPLRKNKTFWFGNYEGFREIEGENLGAIVPTAAERAGNFSSYLTGNVINLCGAGGPANLNFDSGQMFNPATLSQISCPAGSAKAGQTVLMGTPVAGNQISTIDPVAQKVLALIPLPQAGRAGYTTNFVNNIPRDRRDNQFDVRIDHSISQKDQIFVRYLFGQSNIYDPSTEGFSLPGFGDNDYFRGQNVSLGWTHTINPQLLNEVHLGFQRNWSELSCEGCPKPPGFVASFGINQLQATSPREEGYPDFGLSNFASVGDSGYRPNISPDMLERYQDNLTWIHGRHTLLFGVDIEPWQVLAEQQPPYPRGTISFNGIFSSLGREISGVSGVSDLSDLLQGFPSSGEHTFRFADTNRVGGGFWNLYAQDEIKVSRNLAITVGLRWEYRRNAIDKRGDAATLVDLGPNFTPGDATIVTALPAAQNDALCTNPTYAYLISSSGHCLIASSSQRTQLGFSGRNGETLLFPYWKDFAPRVGIAWRPTNSNKFVVRVGAGTFYDLTIFNEFNSIGNNPVSVPTTLYTTTLGAPPPLTAGLPTNTENIFLSGGVPSLISQFVLLSVPANFQPGAVQQWSSSVSSQLAQNLVLEVDYTGSRGTHLPFEHYSRNQPLPGVGSNYQARRPFPDFGSLCCETSDANATYNSLQTKLTKRLSGGVTLLAAYTYAKSIDDSEGDEGFSGGSGNTAAQNDNDVFADKARSENDARQRFVASYIMQLPVGSGRRYLNHGGVLNTVLGGWELSGITTLQTGFPFSVRSSDYSNSLSNEARPDRLCQGVGPRTVAEWFNTSCFSDASLKTALANGTPRFGTAGRNILDEAGTTNLDLALHKRFALTERFKLEFRGEFYNTFNTPNFGYPGVNIDNATVGKISAAGTSREIQFALKLSF